MPIVSRIFPQGAQGIGPAALRQIGATIEVEIAVPAALEQQLRSTGQPVPTPVKGMALIDTGATISAVDDSVIRSLNVNPVGLTTTGTAGGPAQQNLYPARFGLPTLPGVFEFGRVLGANLTGLNILALIGRDVLSIMLLVYNGPLGIVTLSI